MFFYVAKIGWFVLQPSNAILFLLLLGLVFLVLRWWRLGRLCLIVGVVALLGGGLSPLGNIAILPLEDRFPRWDQGDGPAPTGIVLLGGSLVGSISAARDQISLNEAAERLTATAELALTYPDARIILSGGDAGIVLESFPESPLAAEFLVSLGVERSRIEIEDKSVDTYENAVYSKEMADPEQGERWLVVTSAYHMPRAVGVFRQVGFDIEPYPTDFRTRGDADMSRPFYQVSEGLRRVDTATREWIGLLVYHHVGRTDTAFPGPDS